MNDREICESDEREKIIAVGERPLQLSSHELFRHGSTVRIDHQGQIYWLRLTRGNKLILTK